MFHDTVPAGAFSAFSFDAALTISGPARNIVAIDTVFVVFITLFASRPDHSLMPARHLNVEHLAGRARRNHITQRVAASRHPGKSR
ncbi:MULTISPECIES: hypothetical protein [unclassified Caballeronia]|uniref:hypothetical protein n=1 Tax=unclassified Caballeronia TaxID=2646786 RepID=UPI002860B5A0|nr:MULTISPECIES: hypothetical protein [unclassified Caballeronia]MDR5753400.1 hypothetical protein [Caballeronia sp. LZ024]MDR5841139.1 hypothetical protein [Caballeronia sp. LZ031]